MNHEFSPQPEREQAPKDRFFNIDAMSDEQIVMLYRGLDAAIHLELPADEHEVKEDLIRRLVAEVADLATRDLERVRNLVTATMQSADETTGCFAADVAGALVPTDYEFARETLMTLSSASGDRCVQAGLQITFLDINGVLAPEQSQDWSVQLQTIYEQR